MKVEHVPTSRPTILAACALLTACAPSTSGSHVQRVEPVTVAASVETAAPTVPSTLARIATPRKTAYVRLQAIAADPRVPQLAALAERELTTAGFATQWPGTAPDQAALAAADCTGFVVGLRVEALEIARGDAQAVISCAITVHVAAWAGTDGGERWEPGTMATARGRAKATASLRQVDLGVRDCVEGALHAVAAREVVPFIRARKPAH